VGCSRRGNHKTDIKTALGHRPTVAAFTEKSTLRASHGAEACPFFSRRTLTVIPADAGANALAGQSQHGHRVILHTNVCIMRQEKSRGQQPLLPGTNLPVWVKRPLPLIFPRSNHGGLLEPRGQIRLVFKYFADGSFVQNANQSGTVGAQQGPCGHYNTRNLVCRPVCWHGPLAPPNASISFYRDGFCHTAKAGLHSSPLQYCGSQQGLWPYAPLPTRASVPAMATPITLIETVRGKSKIPQTTGNRFKLKKTRRRV